MIGSCNIGGTVKSGIKIFTGSANPQLAIDIANMLDVSLGEITVSQSIGLI